MADRDHRLARVRGAQVLDRNVDALPHLLVGLAARRGERALGEPAGEVSRPALLHLVGGERLPLAELQLAQALVHLRGQPETPSDGSRDLLGADHRRRHEVRRARQVVPGVGQAEERVSGARGLGAALCGEGRAGDLAAREPARERERRDAVPDEHQGERLARVEAGEGSGGLPGSAGRRGARIGLGRDSDGLAGLVRRVRSSATRGRRRRARAGEEVAGDHRLAGVHRLVGEGVRRGVLGARDPRVGDLAGRERRAGLRGDRAQGVVLDLPPAAHLLDDEARVHADEHPGVRVDRGRRAQALEQARVLGHVVRGHAQVAGPLGEQLARGGVAHQGAVAAGTRVAPRAAVGLDDELAHRRRHQAAGSGRRTRMRPQSSQRTTWSAAAERAAFRSTGLSSRPQPSQRAPRRAAAPAPTRPRICS